MVVNQMKYRQNSNPYKKNVRAEKNAIVQQYEVKNTIELRRLFKEPEMVAMLQYRRIVWTGHV